MTDVNVNIKQIKDTEVDNLSVCVEEIGDSNEEGVVLLFTPDMRDKMEHYHIELNQKETYKLLDFLATFCFPKPVPVDVVIKWENDNK